jgi:hypothetical protein
MGKIKTNIQSLQDLEDEMLDDEYFYIKHKEKMKKKKTKTNDEEGTVSEN